MREGGCFCGAVRYRVEGAPIRVTHCHCTHCRGTSGAAFLTWAVFEESRFRIVKGTPGRCQSRPGASRQFCAGCGTQLTFRDVEAPGTIDVTACSLDRPEELHPEDHVWADRLLPWIALADELPRYGQGRNG